MNKKQLIDSVTQKTRLRRRDISETINVVFDTIVAELAAENKVSIRGLGVLLPIFQNTRLVRNPKTGEEMMFVPRISIKLKVGEDVIRKINKLHQTQQ